MNGSINGSTNVSAINRPYERLHVCTSTRHIYTSARLHEGLYEGLHEGLREGLHEGLREGLREGLHKGLLRLCTTLCLNLYPCCEAAPAARRRDRIFYGVSYGKDMLF